MKINKRKEVLASRLLTLVLIVMLFIVSVLAFLQVPKSFERYCEINQGKGDINCLLSKNY